MRKEFGFEVATNVFGHRSPAIGDFDQDGDVDIVSVSPTSGRLVENRGDGTFEEPVVLSVPDGTCFVTVGDVTGEAAPDLVTASCTANTVSVHENQGDGTFGAPTSFDVGAHPTSVATADLNGDGHADLAVANRESHDVSVIFGRGDDSFAAAASYDVGGTRPVSVVAGPLVGDQYVDLAVASFRFVSVRVLSASLHVIV